MASIQNTILDEEDKTPMSSQIKNVQIAVVGNVDSGKSTIIGILTGGILDDGRGKARERVFVHKHEAQNGRTSCISQHLMGFDKNGKAIRNKAISSATSLTKTKNWKMIIESSKNIVTLIDLAGHEKYLKTTIAGLTGCYPDYVFIVVNSLAGITKMTKEHLSVANALNLHICVIVTKIDIVPVDVLKETKKQLSNILKSTQYNKIPITITEEKNFVLCNDDESSRLCPVFYVSSVTGKNIDLLEKYMSSLLPKHNLEKLNKEPVEFVIDEIFNPVGAGLVVSGTVRCGTLYPGTTLQLGPALDGSFISVLVRTIHYKRVPVDFITPGNACSMALRAIKKKDVLSKTTVRKAMVLIDPKIDQTVSLTFNAEIFILHHHTTIKKNYSMVIHCGNIRQTATIVDIDKEYLRTGDTSIVKLKFQKQPEFLKKGEIFIFREGTTKGIGRVKDFSI